LALGPNAEARLQTRACTAGAIQEVAERGSFGVRDSEIMPRDNAIATRRPCPVQPFSWLLFGLACLLAVVFVGCAPKAVIGPEPKAPDTAGLAQKADSAWEDGDYRRAEELYLRLGRRQSLPGQERVRALRRAAESAVHTGNSQRGEEALAGWSRLDPEAKLSWAWQSIQADLLLEQGEVQTFRDRLKAFCVDSRADWPERRKALDRLTDHFLTEELPNQAWSIHREFYAATEQPEKLVILEKSLLERLRGLDEAKWRMIRQEFSPETDWQYPYALVEWASSVHQLRSEQLSWSHAWERLSSLLERSRLESKPHLHTIFVSLEEQYGQPALGVAMLLPLSGVYKDIGWNICRGVDVALWQLNRLGVDIHVRLINTMEEQWIRELERLPKNYMAVGGPLRQSTWKAIMARGLQNERVFFAFRPELSPGWEGIDGYRFFPSHQDQLRPLVRLMTEELGISSFGILYPESTYGRRMAESFWRQAVEHQGQITALASYSPRSHSRLRRVVGKYLKVPEEEIDRKEPEEQAREQNGTNATANGRPEPDFQAVFIPDSFNKARLIIPEFFYFDEPRLIFLGPALWSQEMEDMSKLDRQYYTLAAMTGAWWSGRSSPAAQRLRRGLAETAQGQPDFWVGLGYDYLRFASSLGPIPPDWSPERITKTLASFSGFHWSIAPLSWNRHGEVNQDLYVFRALERKRRLLDPQRLKKKREEIVSRFEKVRERAKEQAEKEESQGGGS